MDNATERLLFEHLGEAALCYLLALGSEQLLKRIEEPEVNRLDEKQEEVFLQLVELDSQLGGWQEGKSTSGEWATRLATRPDNGIESTMGNFARELAGGSLYTIPQDLDELEKKALAIALENYPGMIVKETDDPLDRRISLPAMRYKNVLVEEFEELVIKDPIVKKLFTKKDDTSGWSGYSTRSSGQGGGHQVWGFADTIVNSGWSYAKLQSETPSIQELADGVLLVIDKIRKAVKGKEVTIPARIGLTGMVFPEGVDEIDLGWAKLRRASNKDERFVKATTLKGQLTGTNQKGETTVIDYSGNLVAEIDVPYIVNLKDMGMGALWPEELRIGFRKIEEAVENLRLGLLLAFQDERLVLHLSWQVMLDPLTQYHGASWQDVTRAVNLMPTSLSKAQVTKWKKWAERIGANRIPTIGVAIRRLLAAVAERRTPEDILVDAVIVWENLFGARTETTLRVSSSLAWLLGDNANDRKDKQSKYKKIYDFRSKVVHGSPDVNEQKLVEYSQDAVQISISALAAIFEKSADLLNIKSSEERSIEIIHRGESPTS
jgi:hypothetical protein